ncbi:hypothetical protein MMC12_001336 [Toensbergia leucococca]|nr:hypothetical protein [Toensbergia leucococca]
METKSSPSSEISDWEVEDGLPQLTDQFIQKYLQGREALIEQEKAQRSDYAFRQTLTPLASEACAIVSRIRAEEHRTIWTNDFEDEVARKAGLNHFPGMMFTLAKDRMEKTRLWQIVRKMPKGALLHAHMDAMIDVDWLIDQVMATDGMTILADYGLCSAEARETGCVRFQFTKTLPRTAPSIWSKEYRAQQLVPLEESTRDFPEGGEEGFKTWLKDRCTITQGESLNHHHGLDAVWRKFVSCFRILGSMLHYEPIFRAAVQRLLHQLLDDGLRWVDFRMAFQFQYRREGSEEPVDGYEEVFRVFGEEIEKFKASKEGKQFWGCRMIWTTLRAFGKKDIVESMKQCISVKKVYPDLIAGFDVVGQEDLGRPLADLTPELFWFRKRCVEEGVDIPFFFHAGECLGDGDATDQNLFDAILLGTRRIGHGFSLYKHPLLIEMVKQKKILIESCPISNEVLRLTSSIMSHPLPALLARGVTVALCNDDPAILGHGKNGVTHDFWQALQAWENLGLEGLGSLAENSIRYAAFAPDQTTKEWNKDISDGVFGDGVRASRLREWGVEWNKFCEWIVMEFAADYGGDEE